MAVILGRKGGGAAGGGSQSLAQVLVVGNDPDGTPIHGADFGGDLGANVTVGSGTEGSGGELRIESGSANLIDGVGGSLIVESGGGYQGGLLAITAGGSAGDGSPGGDVDIDGGRADGAGADGGQVNFVGGVAGGDGVGGAARLVGGDSQGSGVASEIVLYGMPAVSGDGKIYFLTDGSGGNAGQVLGSDGASAVVWQTPAVRVGAGVPTGAPGVAEVPFAYDTTASTGGFYFWDGAAWVKVATIL